MPAKYATTNNYSAAEMLAIWTECSAQIGVTGVSYAIAGKSYTSADADKVLKQIEFWEARVNAESPPAANFARLVRR